MKINKIIALLFPSRRGNQLNGNKFNLFEKTIGDQVPLSQGKPIEWKQDLKGLSSNRIWEFPSRRGNQLNGNTAQKFPLPLTI